MHRVCRAASLPTAAPATVVLVPGVTNVCAVSALVCCLSSAAPVGR
jgi:hypothetical protein